MTNIRTLAGAVAWAMVSVTMAFAALEPVHAASACPMASASLGQVCATDPDGSVKICKPILA
jgi:hypothetical protein